MASFNILDRNDARFAKDFDIAAVQPHQPSAADLAYIEAVQSALAKIAAAATADTGASMREALAIARRQWREGAVSRLRAGADSFANGTLDGDSAKAQSDTIMADYDAANPQIALAAVSAPQFPDQLALTVFAFKPDPPDQFYLNQLKAFLDRLDADEAQDVADKLTGDALDARRKQRTDASRKLKDDYADWCGGYDSEEAAANVSFVAGSYRALRDRLGRPLFSVHTFTESDKTNPPIVDFVIRVESDLPGPEGTPSAEQQSLFVQINNASTIIDAVCRQIRTEKNQNKRADLLRQEYMGKLAGIARVGLQGPHTALAVLALTGLKAEFVAREADRIFNRYLRVLGQWAGGFAIVFLAAYILIRANYGSANSASWLGWWNDHKTFLLACTGASLGTWASFSIRQVNLTFEQLIAPEENLADPPLRIIFVVILTLAACLLFWNDAINVKIGNLNTEPGVFTKNGTVAMLIGFFCGISERALALAIGGRATSFVGGIAGGK